jgi:hypothetical protein
MTATTTKPTTQSSEFVTYDEAYAHLCNYLVNELGYWRLGEEFDAPLTDTQGRMFEYGDTVVWGCKELLSICTTQWGTYTLFHTY